MTRNPTLLTPVMRRTLSRILRAVALGGALLLSSASIAAAQNVDPPKPYQLTDQNYVSLTSLSLSIPTTTIGIGQPGQGGLTYSATYDTSSLAWRHSTFGGIYRRVSRFSQEYQWYQVTVTGQSVNFRDDGFGTLELIEGSGAGTLVFNAGSNTYTYTDRDGTVATFDKTKTSYAPYRSNQGLITKIVKPNGEVIDYTYTAYSSTQRIQSVSNNLGYQIHFDYASNVGGTSAWSTVTKVTAFNMGVDSCAPSALTCTFSRSWPSLTFAETATEKQVTDTLGRTLRLIGSGGSVSAVARPTTPSGQNLSFTYDTSGASRISSASDGLGTWTYAYVNHAMPGDTSYDTTTTVTDPLSHVTKYDFQWTDPFGDPDQPEKMVRLDHITDALNQIIPIYQDALGVFSVIHPEGDIITYPRTGEGNPAGVTRTPKGSTTPVPLVTLQYADCSTPIRCGRPTAMIDGLGNVTDMTYDAAGNLLTQTRPAPSSGAARPQTRYTHQQQYAWYFTGGGSPVQAPTPVWRQTASSVCATTASCTGAADEVVSYTTYEAGSGSHATNLLPVTSTSGSGDGVLAATTTTTWDANGDATYLDGPLFGTADTTRTIFDAMRQAVGVIGPDPDASGSRPYPAIRTTYNADGQVTTIERGTTTAQTDPAWTAFSPLQTATALYNAQGRKQRDAGMVGSVMPSVTDYAYDAAGNSACTTVRMNPTTFGTVTGACTMTTAGTFGPDRKRTFTYDQLNREVTTRDAVDSADVRTTSTQAYTPNGKVDWIEDAAGNRSNYIYDGFDRLYRLEFPSATVGAHTSNPSDFEQYGYDAADNPTTKQTRAGLTFTTTFDALNRATVITAPVGSNSVEYLYDLLDRRTSASHAVGGRPVNCSAVGTLCMAWDALGRQASETGPLGAMAYQYDLAGRRTRMTWPDAIYVTYAWDLDGSMTAITLNGSSTIATYVYDNLARRTGIARGNGVPTTYVWDTASYLTSLTQNPTGSAYDLTYGFTYNPVGQVLGRTMSNSAYDFAPVTASVAYTNNGLNQNTVVGGATLTWNTQGNLTSDGTRTFTYDAANRLTGTTISTLTYDPLDRLSQMTGTDAGRFQYDGNQVAAVYPAASSTIAERYVRGPNPDEWAVIYAGSGTGSPTYPLQNHQQSAITLTDASGTATSTLAYDAYGMPRTGNLGRFQYTGQMMLPDFGLQHYKARAYYAGLGRFVQTDPAGYAQGLNLYGYGGLDPVNAADSSGMVTQERFDQQQRRNNIGGDAVAAQNRAAAESVPAAAGIVADLLPVVGDVKGVVDFANDPSWVGAAAIVVGLVPVGGDVASAAMRNSDVVVRGGRNVAESFERGSGVARAADGTLSGVSVRSRSGATAEQLAEGVPHTQVGSTTVGEIRAAGGSIERAPTRSDPDHCLICNVDSATLHQLFTPTFTNPNPLPRARR